MFSKSCEYGIKLVIYIAQHSSELNPVNVGLISKGINAPEFFIAKILQDLSKKRFINSLKGPKGGFFITEEQRKLPIMELVKIIDGDDIFSKCVLGLENCSNLNPCPMHNEYQNIRKDTINMLENNSIQDFCSLINKNKAVLI